MSEHTPGLQEAIGRWLRQCDEEDEAAARLIAAAADLLAALIALAEEKSADEDLIRGEWGIASDPGYGEPSPELVAARAAIAKATGK